MNTFFVLFTLVTMIILNLDITKIIYFLNVD